MKIGIDARLYGLEHAGLGRYVQKLITEILKNEKKHQIVLFLKREHFKDFEPNKNLKLVETNIPIYSFSEQLVLPWVFKKEKLDLLHVPHFNAPIMYQGKMLVTIHDLIKHSSKGPETTTRHHLVYFVKRLGYLIVSWLIAKKAKGIIVPTQYVKNEVVNKFKVSPEKIFVTYEAVDTTITKVTLNEESQHQILTKYHLTRPFVIYTGSVYPHKNVETLIQAIKLHNQRKEADLMLAISCARSIFYDRIDRLIKENQLENTVKLLGFVPDKELSELYSLAMCLVHPSKMEGFGLTGLEAMKAGLPVISSNATCLPEVYGDAAKYFDPDKVEDLVGMIEYLLQNPEERHDLSIRGVLRSKRYSWYKMGKETRDIYHRLLES